MHVNICWVGFLEYLPAQLNCFSQKLFCVVFNIPRLLSLISGFSSFLGNPNSTLEIHFALSSENTSFAYDGHFFLVFHDAGHAIAETSQYFRLPQCELATTMCKSRVGVTHTFCGSSTWRWTYKSGVTLQEFASSTRFAVGLKMFVLQVFKTSAYPSIKQIFQPKCHLSSWWMIYLWVRCGFCNFSLLVLTFDLECVNVES